MRPPPSAASTELQTHLLANRRGSISGRRRLSRSFAAPSRVRVPSAAWHSCELSDCILSSHAKNLPVEKVKAQLAHKAPPVTARSGRSSKRRNVMAPDELSHLVQQTYGYLGEISRPAEIPPAVESNAPWSRSRSPRPTSSSSAWRTARNTVLKRRVGVDLAFLPVGDG